MKIFLAVMLLILVALLGLFFLVNVVYEPEPEQIVYPTGELSDSIFVGQNNVYQANSSLTKTHSFITVPYKVDVPDVQEATIGSGNVFEVSDSIFVYVTEFDDMTQVEDISQYDKVTQMQDILASQFPSALLINYLPEQTQITVEASGSGFINGFTAYYLADKLYVTDGAQGEEAALMGYILDIADLGFAGKHVFVSVGTTNITNQSINDAYAVLSAIIKTVRKDDDLYKEMTKDMDLEALAQDGSSEDEAVEDTGEDTGEDVSGEDTISEGDDVYERTIYLDADYEQVQFTISWENPNPDVILELFLPGGTQYCDPLTQNELSAQFVLTNAPAGDYILRMKNYAKGGEVYDGMTTAGSGSSYTDSSTDDSEDLSGQQDSSSSESQDSGNQSGESSDTNDVIWE